MGQIHDCYFAEYEAGAKVLRLLGTNIVGSAGAGDTGQANNTTFVGHQCGAP